MYGRPRAAVVPSPALATVLELGRVRDGGLSGCCVENQWMDG